MIDLLGYRGFFGTTALTYAVICLGLNLQWGQTGLFNVGIAGFVAIGAYTSAILTTPPGAHLGGFGLPIALGWLGAMLLAGAASAAVGALTLRLRADYLAITTFGIAVTVQLVCLNSQALTGGPFGIGFIPRPFADLADEPRGLRLAGFGLAAASRPWSTRRCRRLDGSPWGRVLRAIRDDETAVAALGRSVTAFRLQSFALGGAVMGLGGAMQAHAIGFIAPDDYLPALTFQVWTMLILGGAGIERRCRARRRRDLGAVERVGRRRRRPWSRRPAGPRRGPAARRHRHRAVGLSGPAPARPAVAEGHPKGPERLEQFRPSRHRPGDSKAKKLLRVLSWSEFAEGESALGRGPSRSTVPSRRRAGDGLPRKSRGRSGPPSRHPPPGAWRRASAAARLGPSGHRPGGALPSRERDHLGGLHVEEGSRNVLRHLQGDRRPPSAPLSRCGAQSWALPTWSAIIAPRDPRGFSRPSVVSCAVWCSSSAFSSPPRRTMTVEIHSQTMKPTPAPSDP